MTYKEFKCLWPYERIGEEILRGNWGISSIHKSADDLIRSLQAERIHTCLLVSIYKEMNSIREMVEKQGEHPVSDGQIKFLRTAITDRDFKDIVKRSRLTVRARMTIEISGVQSFSEFSISRFTEIKGCGISTAKELMRFKGDVLSGKKT